MTGQQLTIAKVAGVVAILIAILYGGRVASGSLFAILQTAGAVVFGWPKQLAIALIFGYLAWVSLRQSMLYRLLQFFTAGAVGLSWPKQLGIALIVGCLAWVFLRP